MRFRNKVALIISAEGVLGRLIMLMCISFLIIGCTDDGPRLSHPTAPQGANFSCIDPRLVTGFAEVHFREGSTEMLITDDRFREKFQWLLKSPERDRGFIVIEGHVDHHEADTMDGKTLSLRRAEAVADKFSALGLDRRYLVPVGRGDSMPFQSYSPGSRVEPANRRASFNPTRFNRTCDEYLLLQDAFFYLQNCRGMQSRLIGRASTRDLCERAIGNVPEGLQEIVRSGRIGTPQ
ncbi:MAG: OmpA family protein [Roseomonas sp.]|nr:OmpA family protein [Roseomonas sp.]